jgi:hypothetical protein
MKTPHQSINEALKRVYEDVSERELMKLYPSEYQDFYQAACENGCEHQEAHEEAIMGLQDWHKDRESEKKNIGS